MRRTVITAIVLLLLGIALPAQASAYWFNPWDPYDYSQSRTTLDSGYNSGSEQSYNSPVSNPEPAPASGDDRVEKIIETGKSVV